MRAEIKLVPPVPGRTPFYYVRGTYLKQYVEESTRTSDRAVARKVLEKIKSQIERGEFSERLGPTFMEAAEAYMAHGGERRFMTPILLDIGTMLLSKIDQAAIDKAAMTICPTVTPATRNREVYTPISAVLRHAGISLVVRRPRGAQGTPRTAWLKPDDAKRFLSVAWSIHPRFAALCTFLLYTGCRLSEALDLQISDLHGDYARIGMTKNGEPRGVHLPPVVVQAIRIALMHPANATWTDQKLPRAAGPLFCLTKSGALYKLLTSVEEAAGIKIPDGVSFHVFRHSYGAWMRRFGGVERLEETGAWSSRAGASSYDHYDVSATAKRADLLPGAQDGAGPELKVVRDQKPTSV